MITTRALDGTDVTLWRAVRQDGIKRFPTAFLPSLEEAQATPEAIDIATLQQGNRFAAFNGDAPVGIAGVHRNPMPRAAHRGEVGPFYVVPEAQGQGAAKLLMRALVARAKQLNIWQLELTVTQTNARAIGFYEGQGFVRRGEMPNAILGVNGLEDDYFYTLDLR